MKILFIGLGSIGQRHLRNFVKIYGKDNIFMAYRTRGLQITFSDSMQIRDNVNLDSEYNIQVFNDLDEALKEKPDVAFVTTITSKHFETAKKVLAAGIDVFIEKPLSDKKEGLSELIRLRDANKCVAFVGFQNRFNPGLIRLKEIVSDKRYGNVISVMATVGERLSSMHSYEDYSQTYMARSEMGGGVVLNQMIHEIDYLQWIFGTPCEVYSDCEKNSTLKIDVEDCCNAIYKFDNDNGHFSAYVHADFIQYPPQRKCIVVFENATVEVDLLDFSMKIAEDKVILEKTTRNDLFIAELKLFMDYVVNRKQESFTLEEGITSLEMAIGALSSSTKKQIMKIGENLT